MPLREYRLAALIVKVSAPFNLRDRTERHGECEATANQLPYESLAVLGALRGTVPDQRSGALPFRITPDYLGDGILDHLRRYTLLAQLTNYARRAVPRQRPRARP